MAFTGWATSCAGRGRHVFTEGRGKDLINRGGEKISCEEVENLIYAHPKVRVVTLVAMPDPVFGEKACAFVRAEARPETLAFDELIAFLRRTARSPRSSCPSAWKSSTELPLSPVGKILKRELRERITETLAREASLRGARRETSESLAADPPDSVLRVPDEATRSRPAVSAIVERDLAAATYGWGVVFTDIALAFVRDIAPELYAAMTRGPGGARRDADCPPWGGR